MMKAMRMSQFRCSLSLPLCMSCQLLWDGVGCVAGGVAAHLEDWAWWRLMKVLVSQACLFDSTHQRKAPSIRSIHSKTNQWQSLETTQPLILTAFILGLGKSCLIHTASDSLCSGTQNKPFRTLLSRVQRRTSTVYQHLYCLAYNSVVLKAVS
jgi:hypothetical protein